MQLLHDPAVLSPVAVEKVPGTQVKHNVAPEALPYMPVPQLVQFTLPSAVENEPGQHPAHCDGSVAPVIVRYVPAVQLLHTVVAC